MYACRSVISTGEEGKFRISISSLRSREVEAYRAKFLHSRYETLLIRAFTEEGLAAEQLGYVVPLPLSLRSLESRKPRFERGSEIIGKCMRLR
jgi:hypothetical protein